MAENAEEELLEEEIFAGTVWARIYHSSKAYAKKVAEDLKQLKVEIEELYERVRRDARRLPDSAPTYRVVAIDSSFTPMTIATYAGTLGAIVYGYLVYPSRLSPQVSAEIISVGGHEGVEEHGISRRAKALELKTALHLLKLAEGGELEVDVIVRDGDFPPTEVFFDRPSQQLRKLRDLTSAVVAKASSCGIGVAGIVKRIRSSLIAFKYRGSVNRHPLMEDGFISRIALRPGEYLYLGRYGDEVDGEPLVYAYFSNIVKSRLKRDLLDRAPELRNVSVLYYRPPAPASPPIKVLSIGVDPTDFAAFAALKSSGGYPHFLNLIDMAVMEYSRRVNLEALMCLALRRAAEEELRGLTVAGRAVGFAFEPLNRQKMRMFLSLIKRYERE